MSQLEIANLHYRYNGKEIIKGLDFHVGENEIVGLLGSSGCGKTTTLKAIAGLIEVDSGTILIQGECADAGLDNPKDFIKPEHRNIGMIFQDYALFPHLTVSQNIAFGIHQLPKPEQSKIVEEMLHLVKLAEFSDRFPHQLSGGQQQRVAIARALAYSPKLLLLDESFSNIDPKVRFELIDDIKSIIKTKKVSAVFVTHSKEEALAFCDRMAIMNDGVIEQVGTPESLFQSPNSKFVAEFLGKGRYLPVTLNESNIESALGSIKNLNNTDLSSHRAGEVLLRARNVHIQPSDIGKGKVVSSHYTSQGYEYLVSIDSLELFAVSPHDTLFSEGDKVAVAIQPHAVNFFPSL